MKRKRQQIFFGIAVIMVFSLILGPLIILRENYYFTIHDYLDSWPSLFNVLRRGNLFFSVDSEMPILEGMSTSYLYFDYGIYRILNYFFGFIWGEIINKAIGLLLGLLCMYKLLTYFFGNQVNKYMLGCIALAYAITPVYPLWTCSFAVLPLYLLKLVQFFEKTKQEKDWKNYILMSAFGFLVYFPCIGIFVLLLWFIAMVADLIIHRRINKGFLISFLIMTISSILFNINILIYVLSNKGLNTSLKKFPEISFSTSFIKQILKDWYNVFDRGQYHANPLFEKLVIPFCILCIIILIGIKIYDVHSKKSCLNQKILRILWFSIICTLLFSLIYSLNINGILGCIAGVLFSFLKGFNFGRIVYINNVLWYVILTSIIALLFSKGRRKVVGYLVVALQIVIILSAKGEYQNTDLNLFHYAQAQERGDLVTYKEFFDEEYFDEIKKNINYNNEGVISVGYHPAVAMYNGFNTLDGYICNCPLDYHYKFRKIIEPSLEQSENLQDYFDGWGGRMYVFIDNYSVDPYKAEKGRSDEQELLINVSEFDNMSGKYIFSRCKISNSAELGIELIQEYSKENSIYDVFIYTTEK